ncbi:hypothetical protein [Novosphingobium jiangmenense]|uniref:Uncharacterized protein n=1 Tax=Novosphingobium jiangmenense TaxID=2791981 RepID=A0ABS0HIS5_9SPHN|nr:hypothetical protein [Novosphingobium jiangmenense]MBF9152157.1 hypothetical protein [Novosphingobium jiangmenense]
MNRVGKIVCLASIVALVASSPLSAEVVSDNVPLTFSDATAVFELPTDQASLALIPDFALDGSPSAANLMLVGQSAGGGGAVGSGAAGAAGAAGAGAGVTGLVVGIVAAIAVAAGIAKAATASEDPVSA